jgi:uncharacterized phage-associated protein
MATKQSKTYDAGNVAKYFIYLASQVFVGDNQEREGLTNLKLQKLLYFAQAYYLAKLGRPLFAEKLEAWEYGPVVPEIYHQFKKFGSKPIILKKDESSISEEDKEFLKKIWDNFGGFSAGRLVEIAHAHAPWKDAFESSNNVITHKALTEYYAPILNK